MLNQPLNFNCLYLDLNALSTMICDLVSSNVLYIVQIKKYNCEYNYAHNIRIAFLPINELR
jgi:hypothetical protein